MMGRLLCLIGFHAYVPDKKYGDGWEICARCSQRRLVIRCMWYDDYKKLPDDVKAKGNFVGLPDESEDV